MVPGTPRWATLTAYGALASVFPSAAWRTALGLGANLGMTEQWRALQDVPGAGTVHVTVISGLSIGAAGLTLGLIYPWGEALPSWLPVWGDRPIPIGAVVCVALTGAALVLAVSVWAAASWHSIATAAGQPSSGGYWFATACYLPALAWSPLLLATTWAYRYRRTALCGS